jgi:hypothetical protein
MPSFHQFLLFLLLLHLFVLLTFVSQ